MYQRLWGDGDKTALLIHGLASSSLTWTRLANHLSSRGYRVIAPDLSGHGLSPRRHRYSVQSWTEEILDLGVKPDLIVGHSMGGLIAANLALHFGDTKTVLLDPVFRFPRTKLISFISHKMFARSMIRFSQIATPAEVYESDLTVEKKNALQWDYRTTYALSSPHRTVKEFFANANDALLIRAKRSYVLPSMKKSKLGNGLRFEYYPESGHNIHREAFPRLIDSLGSYLFLPTQPIQTINQSV